MNYFPLELLSPAGDFERLKAAVLFGADAIYLAGQEFGMRTASPNFAGDQLIDAVKYAHEKGVKVYVTSNSLPRNDEIPRLPDFLQNVQRSGADGLIIADIGVLAAAKKYAPSVPIHASTQVGIVNHLTAQTLHEMGVTRVVLARELSLEQICEIRQKTSPELELETFVHGSMCMSVSGRCLISHYLTGRDANRGDCTQPCRWKYHLMEQNRPGMFYPIEEHDGESYILNAHDLNMIEHIADIAKSGVTSLKIEGRAKSMYYTAAVTKAYRAAIDCYEKHGDVPLESWVAEELNKVSHRPYSTGFFYGTPGQDASVGNYVRDYRVVAVVEGYQDGRVILSQRNRFFAGETADVLAPSVSPFDLALVDLHDEQGNAIAVAPHPMMKVSVPFPRLVEAGSLLRVANAE